MPARQDEMTRLYVGLLPRSIGGNPFSRAAGMQGAAGRGNGKDEQKKSPDALKRNTGH